MRHLLLLVLTLFIFTSEALPLSGFPPDMLEGKTYAQRYFYLDILTDKYLKEDDSATFFNRISEIRQLAIKKNDRGLEREAELLNLSYLFHYHFTDTARCISMLNELCDKAHEEENNILLARLNGMAGGYYWEVLKNYALAFEYYHAEYDLIKDFSVDEYPGKQKAIYILGNSYYFFHDYSNAIHFLSEAFRTDIFGQSLYFTLQSTNSVGLCYQQLGNLDSADYYFLRANAIAATVGNEAWDGITSGNLGYDYFVRGYTKAAVPLLQKDLDLSVKRSDWGCASGSLIVLAEINLAEGKVELAQQQAQQAYGWVIASEQHSRMKSLYPLLSRLHEKQGRHDLAAVYLDSAKTVEAGMTEKLSALQALRIKQTAEIELHRESSGAEKMLSVILNILPFVCIGVLLLLLLPFTRRRLRGIFPSLAE